MTPLDRVLELLDRHQIPHALIGAAALAARGIARSTYDIDLLTTDYRVLRRDVWSTLGSDDAVILHSQGRHRRSPRRGCPGRGR